MDKVDALNIARRFADEVNLKYHFAKVFLFGSFAKDNFREESDIDIAVVLSDYSDFYKTQLDLMRLRRSIDLRIEPHPFKLSEFNLSDPFAYEVITSGIEITGKNIQNLRSHVAEEKSIYHTTKK
ncbi:MAG: nucleotidyltransferase domain-containing protein [Bacteroidia bacterium]|nr:nucleotidyltransferase domain-containing protein [Bacteroidia bacterium]